MEKIAATPENLNNYMSLDGTTIEVFEDGTIAYSSEALEYVAVVVDEDGQILDSAEDAMIEEVKAAGWDLLTGYTGQYGYRGPIMHTSEYIGGQMAKDILSTPGIYTAKAVECEDRDGNNVDDPTGWVVAFKID